MKTRPDLMDHCPSNTMAIYQVDALGSFFVVTEKKGMGLENEVGYIVNQAPQSSEDSEMENVPHELTRIGMMGLDPTPLDSLAEARGFVKGIEFEAKMEGKNGNNSGK